MSIRPLDFQMLIPKSQEQSKINQQNNDKLKIDHQQMVQEDRKFIEKSIEKVNEFDNMNAIYNQSKDSERRQNGNQSKQRKSSNKHKNNDDENLETYLGLAIDIKI